MLPVLTSPKDSYGVYMNLAGADPRGTPAPPRISGRESKLHKLKGYKVCKQAKLGPEAKDSSFVSLCVTQRLIGQLTFLVWSYKWPQLQLFRWSTQFLSQGNY